MRTEPLGAALAYMARGWAVFPTNGKAPATRNGVLDASTEEHLAGIWWERWPSRGVALATGVPSGVWTLDVDGEDGAEALGTLTAHHGRLPDTVTSRTGGGGWHLLYRMPSDRDVRNSASKVGPSIDVRGTGGYAVLPPSGHASGRFYTWLPGRGPEDLSVAEAPRWLLELVAPPKVERPPMPMPDAPRGSRYVRAAIEAECEAVRSAHPPTFDRSGRKLAGGNRNETLNRAAYSLARFVATGEADTFQVAQALAHAAAQAGLGEREIARTLESAFGARGAA